MSKTNKISVIYQMLTFLESREFLYIFLYKIMSSDDGHLEFPINTNKQCTFCRKQYKKHSGQILSNSDNGFRDEYQTVWKKFEDTKGVIRIRISIKNRQHNGQKKKYKRTNNDLQNIHIEANWRCWRN